MEARTGWKPMAPVAWAMAAAIVLAAITAVPAQADDLAEVRGELDAKTVELDTLAQDLSDSQDALTEMDGHIASLLADIDSRQAKRADLQQRIFALAKVMYKDEGSLDFARIVTNSESMGEMLDRMEMRNKVLTEYSDLSAEQKRAQSELEVAYREISNEKDAQYERLAQIQEQKTELDAAVAGLRERESELDATQRKALEEAASAAQQAQQAVEDAQKSLPPTPQAAGAPDSAAAAEPGLHGAEAVAAGQSDDAARQADQAAAEAARQAAEAEAARQAEEAARQAAEEEAARQAAEAEAARLAEEEAARQAAEAAAAEEAAASSSGWMSGLASAYGGSSDPSTPNPGSTATGAVCDDWSMGVAVPMAWGPGAYYGRAVEISYGGTTVVATVNDCGGMGGGARALDLQPGVFKAFGFSTCDDWGVREVQYRFL